MAKENGRPGFLARLSESEDVIWWSIGLALAASLRLSLFRFESGDYISHLGLWYDYIETHGVSARSKTTSRTTRRPTCI